MCDSYFIKSTRIALLDDALETEIKIAIKIRDTQMGPLINASHDV